MPATTAAGWTSAQRSAAYCASRSASRARSESPTASQALPRTVEALAARDRPASVQSFAAEVAGLDEDLERGGVALLGEHVGAG
jgi:hypothetical protein